MVQTSVTVVPKEDETPVANGVSPELRQLSIDSAKAEMSAQVPQQEAVPGPTEEATVAPDDQAFSITPDPVIGSEALDTTPADVLNRRSELEDELVTLNQQDQAAVVGVTQALADMAGTSQFVAQQEEAAGLPGQREELGALTKQIAELRGAFDKEIQAILEQGRQKGRLGKFVTADMQRRMRGQAVEIGALTGVAQALQGNIALAEKTIEKAINYEFQDRQAALNKAMFELENNRDLTAAKREELNTEIEAEQASIEADKEVRNSIIEEVKTVAQNGASQDIITEMLNSKTVEEAIKIGSQYYPEETEVPTAFRKLDNGNTVLVNEQTGEVIKNLGGAKTVETTGGNRSDLSSFEVLAARDLAIRVFGKRAGAKPENYGLVEDLIARGMSIDEIEDKLRYSSVSGDFDGDYKKAFEFIVKSGVTSAERQAAKDGIDELLEDGDYTGAREFILGLARDKAPTEERKFAVGREEALRAFDSIEMGLKAFKDAGGNTNKLKGLQLEAGEWAGTDLGTSGLENEGSLNEIANEIRLAIVDYRRAVSGAAFTESEGEYYESIFPSVGNTPELNQAKLNAIRKTMNRNQDLFYRRQVGSSYSTLMTPFSQTPEEQIQTEILPKGEEDRIMSTLSPEQEAMLQEDGLFDN